jgi:hypothetical protein
VRDLNKIQSEAYHGLDTTAYWLDATTP